MRLSHLFSSLFLLFMHQAAGQWTLIPSGTTSNLVSGCFVDSATTLVISSDGHVFRSLDTGLTWQSVASLQGNFTTIRQVHGDTLVAGGTKFYRSIDGGLNWSLINTFTFEMQDLHFFNVLHGLGIVPGYYVCTWVNGPVTYDNFVVYETMDGGQTWNPVFFQLESNSKFQKVNESTLYFPAGYHTIVAHCAGPWFNAGMITFDSGNTWQPAGQAYNGHSLPSFYNDSCAYFMQPWNSYQIFHSTNVSTSGVIPSYTEFFDRTLKQIKFPNAIDGYALCRNDIYRTGSGGFAWTNDLYSPDSLNFIFGNGGAVLLAHGENGKIFRKLVAPSLYPDTIYRITTGPDSVGFGYVPVNDSIVKTVNIKNTGSLPITLDLIVNAPFMLSLDDNVYQSAGNVTLQPFEDTLAYIKFKPSSDVFYSDSLYCSAPGLVPVSIPLTGNGFYGLTGTISQDTLLCADTILVGTDITIAPGVCVTICPGTIVIFLGKFGIQVNGCLRADGIQGSGIAFAPVDTAIGWNGINILANATDTSSFKYCSMTGKSDLPFLTLERGYLVCENSGFTNPKPNSVSVIRGAGFQSGGRGMRIAGNSFSGNRGAVISCSDMDTMEISGNIFYDNYSSMFITSSRPVYIDSNEVVNTTMTAIQVQGPVFFTRNRIYNNGGGVSITGSPGFIQGNQIYNNNFFGSPGLEFVAGPGESRIIQNLVYNNSILFGVSGGISIAPLTNTQPVLVMNNTVCNNRNMSATGGYADNFYATSNTQGGLAVRLFNNIFFTLSDSTENISFFPGASVEVNYNFINRQDSIDVLGSGNISGQVFFVNPSDSMGIMNSLDQVDWSLQKYSKCINAGDSTDIANLPATDMVGMPRIYNNRVDMGAFEFQGLYEPYPYPGPEPQTTPFSLAPNPAGDEVTLFSGTKTVTDAYVCDVTGRIVWKGTFVEEIKLDLTSFSKGLYLVVVIEANGTVHKTKLVRK